MTAVIGGGPTLSVVSSNLTPVGAEAIPVYLYTSGHVPAGGPATPVRFITDSELIQNGGQYILSGQTYATPIVSVSGVATTGGPVLAVYDVTNKAWPQPQPVPTPTFPPITTGLILNLQADALSVGALNTWPDASGLGHDFVKGAGSATLNVAVVGGKNAVVFNGANDWMDGGAGLWCDNLDSFTCFIVASSVQISGDAAFINKINDLGSGIGWVVYASNATALIQQDATKFVQIGNAFSLAYEDDIVRLFSSEFLSRAEGHLYVNGIAVSDGDAAGGTITTYSSPLAIELGRMAADGDYTQWKARAIMIFTPALSNTDRATMEAALKTKWGTP